jgi:hypothetical protein
MRASLCRRRPLLARHPRSLLARGPLKQPARITRRASPIRSRTRINSLAQLGRHNYRQSLIAHAFTIVRAYAELCRKLRQRNARDKFF